MPRISLIALSLTVIATGAVGQTPQKFVGVDQSRVTQPEHGSTTLLNDIAAVLMDYQKVAIADIRDDQKRSSRERLAASLQPIITRIGAAFSAKKTDAAPLKQSLEALKRQVAENRSQTELNRQIRKINAEIQRLRERAAADQKRPNVLGKVKSAPSAGPADVRSICDAARSARKRNSPAAPSLEAQCRSLGGAL